jgi:hypothetical protein
MKKVVLFLLFGTLVFSAFGQKKPPKDSIRVISYSTEEQYKKYLPNYAPQSPNAAGMQQLYDYQVNLATGNPDISIPLYTVTDGGISQPIVLRYQASGHRLKELASWVGWGWSLDYGSPLNRSLQGLPDDKDGTFGNNYLNNPIITTDNPDLCNSVSNYTFVDNIRDNTGDSQPDIFSYAIGSKSGKFFLGQGNNPPYLIPFQPIKINKGLNTNGFIQRFELIDDDGKSYHYGLDSLGNSAVESQNMVNGQTSHNYISSWQLTSIQSPNTSDHINFYYQNGGGVFQEDKQWSASIIANSSGLVNGVPYYNNTGSTTATATTVYTNTSQSNIHKITFSNGELEFIQNTNTEPREDQSSSKYLKKINVYHYENGIKKLQKIIEFSYSYFKDADSSNGRLKLDRVRFRDTTNTIQLDYNLAYHTNYYSWTDNNFYQPRQDFFGYYNGFPNQSLIPLSSYNVGTPTNPNIIPITNGGANRSTVATYMKQGVLKQITYPTGGFTTFDYETNQYQHDGTVYLAGGLRVKEIKSYHSLTALPIMKRYIYGTVDSVGVGYFTTNWFPQSATIPTIQSLRYANLDPAGASAQASQYIFNSNGMLDIGTFDVSPVYYTWVKEYFEDDTAQIKNGRNEYNFGFRRDFIVSDPGYHTRDIKTWLRGQLLEKRTYDTLNVLKSKTTNTYQEFKVDFKTVAGYVNTTDVFQGNAWNISCPTGFLIVGGSYEMFYRTYQYPTGHLKMVASVSVLDSVVTTTNTTYDTNLFVKKTETSDSYTNHKYIQESVYPTDASYDADLEVLELRNRHMIGMPLESIEKEDLNGTINTLHRQKTVYNRFAGNNARGLIQNSLPSEIWVAPTGGTLEKRVENTAYDTDGNPTEYKVDGIPTTLVWGYGGDLLLGQIQNATATEVSTALSYAGISSGAYSVTNLTSTQLADLQTFRNSLPNSLVTWYSHRPNVGLSQIIAPNGLKSSFVYDSFQRLKFTKDHEGNLTSKNIYEYGLPYNRIISTSPRTATSNENTVFDFTNSITNYQYFDGLGRPLQAVGYRTSPAWEDIVSNHTQYDKFGRVIKKVIAAPTEQSTGNYEVNAQTKAQLFYGDAAPYDSTIYEASPLNRPIQTIGIGQAWRTANRKTQLFYESAGSDIRYYTIDVVGNITLNGFYPANSLFKKRLIDEQGNSSIEITDKRGRLIQKQEKNGSEWLTTYYINDGLGRPLAILQPEAFKLNSNLLQGLFDWTNGVFYYQYDTRGRISEKHIPNGGTTYMVYDKQDREVLKQDAYQRANNLWSFMRYDVLNRA